MKAIEARAQKMCTCAHYLTYVRSNIWQKKLFWSCFEFGATLFVMIWVKCWTKSKQSLQCDQIWSCLTFNYHWKFFCVKPTLFGHCQHRTSQLIIWLKIEIWPFLRNFWLVANVQSGHYKKHPHNNFEIMAGCCYFSAVWFFGIEY